MFQTQALSIKHLVIGCFEGVFAMGQVYLGMNRWDIQAPRQNNFELLPALINLSAPNPDNCADLINVMPRADLGRSRSPVGPEMPKFWSLSQRCSQGVCSCVQSDRSKEFSTVRLAT